MRRASLASITLLVACGGGGPGTDIDRTLRFGDRSDTEIGRLVAAASGSEGFQAQATVSSFDPSFETDPDPCPAIAVSGRTVTITGGCTTRDNVAIEGTARVTNPLGWGDGATEIAYDHGSDTSFELEGLAFVHGGQAATRRSYDGTFVIRSSFTEQSMDITTELLGVAVRSDLTLDCSRTGCSVRGGVELFDAGGAHVSGSISIAGNTATATYKLAGVDTVEVTMKNNCVSWKLVGTERGFDPCNR